MKWAAGVNQEGLMNLLFMPHFGHSLQDNTYVKQLLVYFHRGCLWLDQPYPVDVELISAITGLPKSGEDPASCLCQGMDITKMKTKYKLQRKGRGSSIPLIEDPSMQFTARILSCKLLHKMSPNECTIGAVEIT